MKFEILAILTYLSCKAIRYYERKYCKIDFTEVEPSSHLKPSNLLKVLIPYGKGFTLSESLLLELRKNGTCTQTYFILDENDDLTEQKLREAIPTLTEDNIIYLEKNASIKNAKMNKINRARKHLMQSEESEFLYLLLDADSELPDNYFTKVEEVVNHCHFDVWSGQLESPKHRNMGFIKSNHIIHIPSTNVIITDKVMLQLLQHDTITEDVVLSYLVWKQGHRLLSSDLIVGYRDPVAWWDWVFQRARWIKGYLQTFFLLKSDKLEIAFKYLMINITFPLINLIKIYVLGHVSSFLGIVILTIFLYEYILRYKNLRQLYPRNIINSLRIIISWIVAICEFVFSPFLWRNS